MIHRKIISVFICLLMTFSLVSCGASVQGALDISDVVKEELSVESSDSVIKVWAGSFFLIDCAEGRSFDEILDRVENDCQTDFEQGCIYTESGLPNPPSPIYYNYTYYILRENQEINRKLRMKADDTIVDEHLSTNIKFKEILLRVTDDLGFPFALSTSEDIPNRVRVSRCEIHEHMSLGYYIHYQTNIRYREKHRCVGDLNV